MFKEIVIRFMQILIIILTNKIMLMKMDMSVINMEILKEIIMFIRIQILLMNMEK